MEHHVVTGVQQPEAATHLLPASRSLGRCSGLAVAHAIELEHRVAPDHHRRPRSMINPSADGFRLELGKPRGELPHTINWLGVFVDS